MNEERALKEVWSWKDQLYEETKHMNMAKRFDYIAQKAKGFREKYHLHLKKAQSPSHR